MDFRQGKRLRLVKSPLETSVLLAQGLVDLYKAVKGASFYPDGHPYRIAPLQRSYDAFRRLAAERELVLSITRNGFAPGGEGAEASAMVLQLARECFVRRIASITFMPDLLLIDLEAFVLLLSADPYRSVSGGGFSYQLQETGVRTILINEKDASAIWGRRLVSNPAPEELLDLSASSASSAAALQGERGVRGIDELLQLMSRETSDAGYQELGRELVERFRKQPEEAKPLLVLEELLRQHEEEQRSLPQREYALFSLERVADCSSELLLDLLVSRDPPERDGAQRVLDALGGKGVYWIIHRITLAEGVFERRALAGSLVRLGKAALGPVIGMLRDQRWYVVRNMAAILGEIGSPEPVPHLKRVLHHQDPRVRKEAVRALMKIGGEPAEEILISLLEEPERAMVSQAVLALGAMRSIAAVPALLKLLERRDLFLKALPLKKELLVALGRIGDRRATEPLLRIVKGRGFAAPGRSLELKISAALALGSLGDEGAIEELAVVGAGKGPLAEACREAIDSIERVCGEDR